MTESKCFLCGKPITWLRNQENVLSHYRRGPCTVPLDDDELEALEAGAYKDSHWFCLSQSPWGFHWARREAASEYAMHQPVAQTEKYVFFQQSHSIMVIHWKGWMISISNKELKLLQPIEAGYLLPISEKCWLDLSEYPDLLKKVRVAFKEAGRFSLEEFLVELEVMPYMLFPEFLKDGYLTPVKIQDLTKYERLKPAQERDHLWVYFNYSAFYPRDVIDTITAAKEKLATVTS